MAVNVQLTDAETPTTVDLGVTSPNTFCDFCGEVITTKIMLLVTSHATPGSYPGAVTEVACTSHLADIDAEVESVRQVY